MTPAANRRAFLDALAFSELGMGLLSVSNNGYNVIVGSTPQAPILFDSYADHPRKSVWIPRIKDYSTAAGRYQVLEKYFDAYKRTLSLPDFGPVSQDRIALQLIRECRALDDIDNGRFTSAIYKCRSRWASLPGAGYGQNERSVDSLVAAYLRAGGEVT